MKKSIQKTHIKGVVFFDIECQDDSRGNLAELFRNDFLNEINFPKMGYISKTNPNASRGPHEHKNQSDLFCFTGPGEFELVLWEKSSSGNIYEERHLVGENHPVAVIIPPGIVHAYKNLSDYPGIVLNFPNQLYGGPGKCYDIDEIRYENDPDSFYVI